MKILIIDTGERCLDFALDCMAAGHDVKVYLPPETTGKQLYVGNGMITKVKNWEPLMKWADFIIVTSNARYIDKLDPYYKAGYPIFGTNRAGGELELNRQTGMDIMKRYGIKTLPYTVFDNLDAAIKHVKDTRKSYAVKPMGDAARELSYLGKTPDDMLYTLNEFKSYDQLPKQFILQEKASGVEMAVSAWFGPGGWSKYVCENFEEKKFMNEGLGVNTGEQGTTIRYTTDSKLFQEALEPIGDYLMAIGYVGSIDMNTIITEKGPMPMEFTTRFGDPTWQIQQFLHKGDPVNWMADLLEGRDTLKVDESPCVGVVISHGDYPYNKDKTEESCGKPIFNLTKKNRADTYFCEMMEGSVERLVGGNWVKVKQPVTAGTYLYVARGKGTTVKEAKCAAYKIAWELDFPSNRMFRTDIGHRLEKQLDTLHKQGYAKGLDYE